MTEKLSFEEYQRFSESGLLGGSPCACLGPRNEEPYCPCMMNFLNMVREEDQPKLMEKWRSNGILSQQEQIIRETEPPMSEFRRRRLELMKEKKKDHITLYVEDRND